MLLLPGSNLRAQYFPLMYPTLGGVSRSLRRADRLELAFDSKTLRDICESDDHARRELGLKVAEILKHRLADLRAATSIYDVVVGNPRLIDDTEYQYMAIDLCDSHRMVFSANHLNNPIAESGKLDWSKVRRIKILRIGRDND
jgi:hypothetical protein